MSRTISELECLRCDYKWFPKSPTKPKVCPRCKSRVWMKPRDGTEPGPKSKRLNDYDSGVVWERSQRVLWPGKYKEEAE